MNEGKEKEGLGREDGEGEEGEKMGEKMRKRRRREGREDGRE